MATIKARAWHKEAKIMLEKGDKYGTTTDTEVFRYKDEGQPVDIMLISSAKDARGNYVGEGDILRMCPEYGAGYIDWIVEFDGYRFYVRNIGSFMEHNINISSLKTRYVVGNKFENPDLVKEDIIYYD